MKKILFLMLLSIPLLFSSCEKMPTQDAKVAFTITDNGSVSKKDSGEQIPVLECIDGTATTVHVTINGVEHVLDVLNLEGNTLTESLKLPTGTYVVSSFVVYNENGEIMWVTPMAGSEYALMWPQLSNVDLEFIVEDFEKKAVPIDVLCFREADIVAFGYSWFDFHAFESKAICFFGDICSKFYTNFNDAKGPYNGQVDAHDFIALFTVEVFGPDGTLMNSATNVGVEDINAPVCVEYLDDLEVPGEEYTFLVSILGPEGYVFATTGGSFTDAEWSGDGSTPKFGGDDGVWEFVVGNCIAENTDAVVLPAYLALPASGQIKILSTNHTGSTYDYFDVLLLGSSWDNALYPAELYSNAILPGWCGDLKTGISQGFYDVNVYSSLKPSEMPLTPLNGDGVALPNYPWDVLNYIANLDLVNPSPNKLAGQRLQSIIWLIIHGQDAATIADINAQGAGHTVTAAMILEANTIIADGAGFSPKTGDWSVVVMTPYRNDNELKWYQFVLVRVDP